MRKIGLLSERRRAMLILAGYYPVMSSSRRWWNLQTPKCVLPMVYSEHYAWRAADKRAVCDGLLPPEIEEDECQDEIR